MRLYVPFRHLIIVKCRELTHFTGFRRYLLRTLEQPTLCASHPHGARLLFMNRCVCLVTDRENRGLRSLGVRVTILTYQVGTLMVRFWYADENLKGVLVA